VPPDAPPALPRADDDALAPYGWGPFFRDALAAYVEASGRSAGRAGDEVGRVAAEHQGGLLIHLAAGERAATVAGRLRRTIGRGEADRPAVGDWVVADLPADGAASIRATLPRRSRLSRKAAGHHAVEQVLAANVDVAFLVSALGRDLNPRRLERYLALILEGGADPVVLLTKADTCADPAPAVEAIHAVAPAVPVHVLSSVTGQGLGELDPYFEGNRTAVLLGSSGVGKSTLLNRLLGAEVQAVGEVRDDGKGRHTTTHRQLRLRPGGGLIIDTPGMREIGLWEAEGGLLGAFADVEALASTCRFSDCRHEAEPGCAVAAAVAAGAMTTERVQSYRALSDEVQRTADQAARRRHTRQITRTLNAGLRRRGR
jgi:ribosome biogenesis GTPase